MKAIIIADPKSFPNGIKALADYVHSKGLKFGIYSCAGNKTCAGRPGSFGHHVQDAQQYAEWGVDYLKYDWCFNDGQDALVAYKAMGDALKATGRPIVFSICEWGANKPWKWAKGIGHLWRISGDVFDRFQYKANVGCGILEAIDKNAGLADYAGPGHWNDPDMLQVGNGGMTYDEYVAHFSMWSMLAAPLMAGNELRLMDDNAKNILMNKEVIAVNQDILGKQARRFKQVGEYEAWIKPLTNNRIAVCFFNRSNSEWQLNYNWKQDSSLTSYIDLKDNKYTIRDLWKKQDIGTTDINLSENIPTHGVLMVLLSPK